MCAHVKDADVCPEKRHSKVRDCTNPSGAWLHVAQLLTLKMRQPFSGVLQQTLSDISLLFADLRYIREIADVLLIFLLFFSRASVRQVQASSLPSLNFSRIAVNTLHYPLLAESRHNRVRAVALGQGRCRWNNTDGDGHGEKKISSCWGSNAEVRV